MEHRQLYTIEALYVHRPKKLLALIVREYKILRECVHRLYNNVTYRLHTEKNQ